MNSIEDLKELLKTYKNRRIDITDKIVDKNYEISPEEIEELSSISDKIESLEEQIKSHKKNEKNISTSNAVYDFIRYNNFNYENFITTLKPIVDKYFKKINYVNTSDKQENYISVFGYLDESNQYYFRFTEDNDGLACIDIKIDQTKSIAGFKNGTWEDVHNQLKNIFMDIANKKLGVHHDNYYLEE